SILYLTAILCNFFAPSLPEKRFVDYKLAPPQKIQFVDEHGIFRIRPFVYGYKMEINKQTFRRTFTIDTEQQYPIQLFVKGDSYKLLGLIPSDIHLIGVEGAESPFFLMGTDHLGRDLF